MARPKKARFEHRKSPNWGGDYYVLVQGRNKDGTDLYPSRCPECSAPVEYVFHIVGDQVMEATKYGGLVPYDEEIETRDLMEIRCPNPHCDADFEIE